MAAKKKPAPRKATSKSQQLLTPQATTVADTLRKEGWGQKEYLSAGVIAFSRADAAERMTCKRIAYGAEEPEKITRLFRLLDAMTDEERVAAVARLRAYSDELAAQEHEPVRQDTARRQSGGEGA